MCKESLIFSNSFHLGPRTGLPDNTLKGDHQRFILEKLGSNWPSSFRGNCFLNFIAFFLFLATVAMLVGGLDCRTQFWNGIIQGLFKESLVPIGPVVSEMKIFKISSPFWIFLVTAAMLVGCRDCRTQLWKRITQGPFHQSLVLIGQVVSEEKIFSNCGRTDDGGKVMTKTHVRLAKGGAYYILSMVKSPKKIMASTITS